MRTVYIMWLREMKRFIRSKSRIIGSLGMPFFFLAFLGFGFRSASFPNLGVDYTSFLAPGIVGMVVLFTSMFAGISLIYDKQFGFLKEIMVAPVSRLSIMIGRTAGGMTTSVLQALIMLGASYLIGFTVNSVIGFLTAIIFMLLTSAVFVSIGTSFASKMDDFHGFQLIMNFFIFPLFLLSGALFPLNALPEWLLPLVYVNPLTYGVDGIRGGLIGYSQLPLLLDLGVLLLFASVFIGLGSYLFRRTEVS